DPAAYTVERLLQIKAQHETHSTSVPAPTDNVADQLLRQINIGGDVSGQVAIGETVTQIGDIIGQVGVIGDHAHIEGGINFGPATHVTQTAGDDATQIGKVEGDVTIKK
ncbi:MAG: hypothetical protein U9R15_17075, partial [Chloroflexota bacterium]|nr:hypothetical protein [Chloroflexota bacterium]